MNVLAFDCCFGAVSVAVRQEKEHGRWLLHEAYESRAGGHAERLFPMIAEVLEEAHLEFSEIDRIAVTLGPGTFTGVRVGVATARAFALAAAKPVVGTTSLAVMAHRSLQLLDEEYRSAPLAVAVDARRGMLYVQHFRIGGAAAASARLLSPAEGARMLGAAGKGPIHIVGSGGAAVVEALRGTGREATAHLPDLQPHAGSLAFLASELDPLEHVAPIYLRQPDVKPQMASMPREDQP
jgi:tRNA threonylcarbamoyladenosine biosynthesis protein TsaB